MLRGMNTVSGRKLTMVLPRPEKAPVANVDGMGHYSRGPARQNDTFAVFLLPDDHNCHIIYQ